MSTVALRPCGRRTAVEVCNQRGAQADIDIDIPLSVVGGAKLHDEEQRTDGDTRRDGVGRWRAAGFEEAANVRKAAQHSD